MAIKPAGNLWLQENLGIEPYPLSHTSYIGKNDSISLTNRGNIERVFGPKYAPGNDNPLSHLEFSLKYDHLNLDFLRKVFQQLDKNDIAEYISSSPSGKYARKIGFLYEFLIGNKLELIKPIIGNYEDLLEREKYITGRAIKSARWRINDNLLGNSSYCPIVRRTPILDELLKQNTTEKIEQLKNGFPPEIFKRATNYLYTKETRSSYEIEKEQPAAGRMEKFVSLLMKAGSVETNELLKEKRLVQLQNAILDKRFAAERYRDFQNFIGETLPGHLEMIHYICPPPEILMSLMEGLQNAAEKTDGTYPEIRAAILGFGFVFIHPFEDGNGRLHRFLIHDILVHDKLVPQGLIIPVSAHMVNNIKDYDNILEKYSKPLMQRIKYKQKDLGEIEVTNQEDVAGYFRYPDLTDQCIYLVETIHATLKEDMPNELQFIQRYDEVKKDLQHIVDMPDRDINLMILFLHQNNGVFPIRRREHFSKLTDQEIHEMQRAYRVIFEMEKLT